MSTIITFLFIPKKKKKKSSINVSISNWEIFLYCLVYFVQKKKKLDIILFYKPQNNHVAALY